MHTRSAVLASLALAASAIAGCGDDDTAKAPSGSGSGKPVKVAYISYVYFDYQQVEERGIKDAVKANGGSVRVFDAAFDPQKLQKQCTDAIQSKRYNAIVLAPVDSASAIPCVNSAHSAGIPVVTIENPAGKDPDAVDPQLEGVVGTVVTTPADAGRNYAKLVDKACAGIDPCKVIAEESPGDPFTNAWVSAADKLPNVTIVQKIDTQFDPGKTAALLPGAIARNGDVDVFMGSQDENALAAVDVFDKAGLGNVKVLGTGGSRRAAKAIAAGTMFGTLGSWPLQTGQLAGEMLTKATAGDTIDTPGVDGVTLDEPQLVTKETVADFHPEWGAR